MSSGRRTRDYSQHRIIVDSGGRTFKIIPRYPSAGVTPEFGLGNATIRLNLDHLPEKIVRPITGESTGSGLIPPDGKKLSSWRVYAKGVHEAVKTITGYNGVSKDIKYPEADNTESYAVGKDEDIEQNGVGFYELYDGARVEW